MQLTKKQNEFVELVKTGKSVFLTGKAGTGKSAVVKYIEDLLTENNQSFIAVAPTGVAANNIDGATIHSTFGLTPFGVLNYNTCKHLKSHKIDVLKKAKIILIDEVSMMRADHLDAMHYTLKKNKLPGLDERQIIFVGDLAQLQPPVDDNHRSVMLQTYKGVEFYHAMIYNSLKVHKIELDEIMRQSDPEFIDALNTVRNGFKHPYFGQFVSTDPIGIILAPHNETVANYNVNGLNKQEGEELFFEAKVSGNVKEKDFQLEKEIRVKHGCKIMYLVNSQNNNLRNGTLGTFIVKDGGYFIRVGEVEYSLKKVEVTKKEYVLNKVEDKLELQEIGSIRQYPFKLAYALSIHKSQGLTFDECTIDLTRACFQKGQMYVALSRVKSPAGLRIII